MAGALILLLAGILFFAVIFTVCSAAAVLLGFFFGPDEGPDLTRPRLGIDPPEGWRR